MVDKKIVDLKSLRLMRDELDKEITALENSIKADMTAEGLEEYIGSTAKVTWRSVTSSRFDSASFKKADPVTYAKFIKTTTARRFLVA